MIEELGDGTLSVYRGKHEKMNVPNDALPCSRCKGESHELRGNNDSADTDASHVATRVNLG